MKQDSYRPHRPPHSGAALPVNDTQILIYDAHPAIQDALAAAIRRQDGLHVAATVSTAEAVKAYLVDQAPDILIMDLFPGIVDGLSLLEAVRSLQPETRVLIYSMHDESAGAGRALRAGAFGFVPKTASTEVVVAAIRQVSQGEVYLSQEIASRILADVIRTQRYGTTPADRLTDREMTVFKGIGDGKSVRDIAEQLNLSRKTVETYRRRAKEKLGYETVDELLLFALEWGAKQANDGDAQPDRRKPSE